MPSKQIFGGVQEEEGVQSDQTFYDEYDDHCSCSNFLDADWLSSSENSEEEICGRYLLIPRLSQHKHAGLLGNISCELSSLNN